MQELQEDWENGLQLIQRHTPELSYAEMRGDGSSPMYETNDG